MSSPKRNKNSPEHDFDNGGQLDNTLSETKEFSGRHFLGKNTRVAFPFGDKWRQ